MTKHFKGLKLVLLAATLLLPVACAETQLISHAGKQMSRSSNQPAVTYKVGSPYRIGDIWYYPHEDFNYTETGVASWYGPNFHGKATANGEIFDQNALTAAHRTLPIPSLVRVTNLDNGRAIVLRINDRGPFAHDRIIDVSRRGAQLLAFKKAGTANVKVEILAQESRTLKNRTLRNGGQSVEEVNASMPPQPLPTNSSKVASVTKPQSLLPPPSDKPLYGDKQPQVTQRPLPPRVKQVIPTVQPTPRPIIVAPTQVAVQAPAPVIASVPAAPGYYIQAAAFSSQSNAQKTVDVLNAKWPTISTPVAVGGRQLFRVRVGPLKDPGVAQIILDKVRATGYPDAHVIRNR